PHWRMGCCHLARVRFLVRGTLQRGLDSVVHVPRALAHAQAARTAAPALHSHHCILPARLAWSSRVLVALVGWDCTVRTRAWTKKPNHPARAGYAFSASGVDCRLGVNRTRAGRIYRRGTAYRPQQFGCALAAVPNFACEFGNRRFGLLGGRE